MTYQVRERRLRKDWWKNRQFCSCYALLLVIESLDKYCLCCMTDVCHPYERVLILAESYTARSHFNGLWVSIGPLFSSTSFIINVYEKRFVTSSQHTGMIWACGLTHYFVSSTTPMIIESTRVWTLLCRPAFRFSLRNRVSYLSDGIFFFSFSTTDWKDGTTVSVIVSVLIAVLISCICVATFISCNRSSDDIPCEKYLL